MKNIEKKPFKGKNAFIDQILLGFFIFATLIVVGATISDNMQARDKYYKLKKVTDNAVLTLSKYYVKFNRNTAAAETIHNDMLDQTKLGSEVKDTITYTWDFLSDPNTVTATIPSYNEETFWFKFLGLSSFNLKAESRATITKIDSDEPTTLISSGLAPFAINDRDFTIGDTITMDYQITAGWQYSDKDTFYPIITNCDCDCKFALSNQFDFSELGFDVDNCDNTSPGCTTQGESEFVNYSKLIDDIYNSEQSINFENGNTDTPICLLGTYLGNTISTWGTQINHLSNGIEELFGQNGENLPMELDIITLNTSATANGIVRVRVDSFEVLSSGQPLNRYIRFHTEVVPAKDEEIKLIY